MKRVMIIGGAGAGKSTLATQLGDITGLPVVHIDPMYWKPGWIQRDIEDTRKMVRRAAEADEWIFDGNNSSTFHERLSKADTLIFLDLSTVRRLLRVIRRTIVSYGKVRPDMQTDCPERFDWGFLKWVAGYARHGRYKAVALVASAPEHVWVLQFRKPAEVEEFLERERPAESLGRSPIAAVDTL